MVWLANVTVLPAWVSAPPTGVLLTQYMARVERVRFARRLGVAHRSLCSRVAGTAGRQPVIGAAIVNYGPRGAGSAGQIHAGGRGDLTGFAS